MKDVKAVVAKNLAKLRKNKGLTQAELAEILNYSDKAVSRWEHGDTLPDINVLYELCSFYEITMNDLVDEECEISNTDKDKKNTAIYRVWLGILTAVVVWLVATVWFIYSQIAFDKGYWNAFVWAVPISCLVLMYICRNVFNWVAKFVFVSICNWTLITAVYLHMLVNFQANLWMIFLIGIPVQALAFLWQKMKKYKNNIPKGNE
ncbi:MAG: helix-turn-helix transcriptional regulator [Clostridia bacterium]|nr:helix-turn-helix transcriptional regulator [Clostridia bacterium]